MPRYSSRKKNAATRERKRVRAQMPRDKRHLSHWAVRGTHDDYARLRKHVETVRPRAPSYLQPETLDSLQGATRRSMLQDINNESWGGSWFGDSLSWLIDQIPNGWGWEWPKALGQAALKPFRGDSLDETDQQYARLVNQGYLQFEGTGNDKYEHWQRQAEFDSNYVTVWDNEDGHRFVSVRGTEFDNPEDLRHDAEIVQRGAPQNVIGEELRTILDNTKPDKVVDLGAHSLGTSLALTAFQADDTLQDRIHQTYLYNPAWSPFAQENVTDKYEADDRVRYFIDLSDPVSLGDLGSRGPTNVVYRNNWNPLTAHKLVQWGGEPGLQQHDGAAEKDPVDIKTEDAFQDRDHDGVPDATVEEGADVGAVAVGDDFVLDLGDDFDSGSWNSYWE